MGNIISGRYEAPSIPSAAELMAILASVVSKEAIGTHVIMASRSTPWQFLRTHGTIAPMPFRPLVHASVSSCAGLPIMHSVACVDALRSRMFGNKVYIHLKIQADGKICKAFMR